MSILGTLSHVTIVHQDRWSYLSALFAFISTFSNEHKPHYPQSSIIKDLMWWSNKLTQMNFARPLSPWGVTQYLGIWVDTSSSWGISIIIGNEWDTWTWNSPWHYEGWDIGWAEAVAVELITQILFKRGLSNASILVRGDNQGVVGSYGHGHGQNFHINLAIRWTEVIRTSSNVLYIIKAEQGRSYFSWWVRILCKADHWLHSAPQEASTLPSSCLAHQYFNLHWPMSTWTPM